eukprot:13271-Chlamydomonas_euryale.AAC.4
MSSRSTCLGKILGRGRLQPRVPPPRPPPRPCSAASSAGGVPPAASTDRGRSELPWPRRLYTTARWPRSAADAVNCVTMSEVWQPPRPWRHSTTGASGGVPGSDRHCRQREGQG